MINVELEKIKGYVKHRLKDVEEIIHRYKTEEALRISFEVEQVLVGEKRTRKELIELLDYIDQIKKGEL